MTHKVSGSVAVFGYGSLVNLTSLAQTIGRPPLQTYYVNLQGWVREWTVAVANESLEGRYIHENSNELPDYVLALNIRPDRLSPFGVNGVLFEATEQDLENLDKREFCYDRIDITKDVLGDHPYEVVYTYVGLPDYLVSPDHAAVIPESYDHVVAEGFKSIDELAYKWYRQSTTPSIHKVEPTRYVLGNS